MRKPFKPSVIRYEISNLFRLDFGKWNDSKHDQANIEFNIFHDFY